jgi:hypothetical protein
MRTLRSIAAATGFAVALVSLAAPSFATPANKSAFVRYFGKYLDAKLNACTTCHTKEKGAGLPTSLKEYPHNAFGRRLARVVEEMALTKQPTDIGARINRVANEDSDGDGVSNQDELLSGHNPGNAKDKPSASELTRLVSIRAEFKNYLAAYRWKPFEPVTLPAVTAPSKAWQAKNPQFTLRNPIDSLLATEYEAKKLIPRPQADKVTLLRRVTIDLIGLNPTPAEIDAFVKDRSPNAYEKVVDRLLGDTRYGERWARHWMDVWRYSDWAGWTDGGQIRDSQPHIWRWRDWIVESLNKDKPYDRMVTEMLAADELYPEDADALRGTGFLARNYKMLSREQWLEDTLNHTSKAFLGITMHCAKCHDHMYDPLSQRDYYRMRAIFEPHQVRIDRVPGQADIVKDGLPRTYDADLKAITYLYPRGDERNPDKTQIMQPGVPGSLGGHFDPATTKLTTLAYQPGKRDFVIKETIAASETVIKNAKDALAALKAEAGTDARRLAELPVEIAEANHKALLSVLEAERLEDTGKKDSEEWKRVATEAASQQRLAAAKQAEFNLKVATITSQKAREALAELVRTNTADKGQKAEMNVQMADGKLKEATAAFAKADSAFKSAPTTAFTPRADKTYPAESTGRRTAFAKWVTDKQNPLAARVAVNHMWARHFGEGIVPSLEDFGRNGRTATNPRLLDWLAASFLGRDEGGGMRVETAGKRSSLIPHPSSLGWSMKKLHRLIVTSSAYRMASTSDARNAKIDPDNVSLWRMNSRRLEAEAVRDNVLWASGRLDKTMGGPEIDHMQGLSTLRRSIYLREAAEKYVEFLQIFDGPNVTECYERKTTVMPQQALALANSELAIREARMLARELSKTNTSDAITFVREAFLRTLARVPTSSETKECLAFLDREAKRVAGEKIDPATCAQKPEDASKPSADTAIRARENLALVLFNHTEFVTVR